MALSSFTELDCWQNARELTKNIYTQFSQLRDFGFRDQIQTASVSIMNNIAEGFGRGGGQERVHFMNIAIGSTHEVQSMLYLAIDLTYMTQKDFDRIFPMTLVTLDKTRGFMRYLKQPKTNTSKQVT